MAKKGQKFQQYTEAFKQRMLEKYRSGIPASVLSKEYGMPENTIKTWEYKSYHPAASHKRGHPKGKINYKERYEILNKSIETQKDKVKMLEEAFHNSSESFGENDKRTKNCEI